MTSAALALCPFPDGQTAAAAAKTLLDERLIACASIVPEMLLLFAWDNERGEAIEAGMLSNATIALTAARSGLIGQ